MSNEMNDQQFLTAINRECNRPVAQHIGEPAGKPLLEIDWLNFIRREGLDADGLPKMDFYDGMVSR